MVRQSVLLHSAAAACSLSSSDAAFGIIAGSASESSLAAAVDSDRSKRIRAMLNCDLSWPFAAFYALLTMKTCFEHCFPNGANL